MKLMNFISKFEKKLINRKIAQLNLNVGNKVRIGTIIKEGEKERIQFFEGIIISINNSSIDTMVTVRRIFQGVGIERTFPIYSSQIESVKVLDPLRAKRAKLFYLRNKVGKSAQKIKGR